jgi:hypothetical protein
MNKAKRIALGGWLNNVLSIATRGWFGAAPEPVTRQTVREALAGLFAGQGFTAIYDYMPVSLRGASKVLVIPSAGGNLDHMSQDLTNQFYLFNLDVFVKRDGASAEDDLDALREAIVAIITANPAGANWSHLQLLGESRPGFAQISGIPYRVERHPVKVKITS